jgi:lipoprotein-releasing system ATP-binding protein
MSDAVVETGSEKVLLRARGVAKSYKVGGGKLDVLRGVDLDVHDGEILAILGKSGCGKSTLLHVLGWLDRADQGEIVYDGVDHARLPARERAHHRNRTMGFVFQFYHLLSELTALENVLVPAMIRYAPGEFRSRKRALHDRAKALLAVVGLGHRMTHRPPQLSGGERQRVAIARALMNQPRFLLCDEPTGNLDGRTAEDVRSLLWDLNARSNQTMIVVTHDAKLAYQAHRMIHLVDGQIESGERASLVEEVEL